MKKIIFLVAGVAFIMAGFAVAAAAQADNNTSELEKISSPEYIKEFRVMKKVGNVLYGIRLKASGVVTSTSSSLTAATTTPANQKLEKISSPELVREYEKIRRVGNALWGIKKAEVNVSKEDNQRTDSSLALATITPEMITCVTPAINIKDQAVIAEVNAAAASLVKAITARGICQQAALQTTGNRAAALNSCVQTFQATSQQINKVAQQAQQEAWTVYNNSLQACHVGGTVSTSTPAASVRNSNGLMIKYDGGGDNVNSLIKAGSDN